MSDDTIKNIVFCLVPMSLFSCATTTGVKQQDNAQQSILVEGQKRSYRLFVPADYDPQTAAPLVLAFHGANGSGRGLQQGIAFDREAKKHGMIVAYPDNLAGNWAEGCGCNNADRLKIDDIGFTLALLDTLKARFSIDAKRVFAVGYSQGALFAQRLACELSEHFAAVACVAATMSVPLSQNCAPQQPVAMLMIHGMNDPIFPWQGKQQGILSVLSANAVLQLWAQKNACAGEPIKKSRAVTYGVGLTHWAYTDCSSGTEVHLYGMQGVGHTWPAGAINASRMIADFFAEQPKK